jgi:large subunit ribosomal protein L5
MAYTPRLKDKYAKEVVPALMEQFQYKNHMQVPRITKICLNQGLGIAITDRKHIESGISEMAMIAGQKPVSTKSRKDISNFKLRKGNPIGVRVTLRGERMYEFLDRLISVALPRVRQGLRRARQLYAGRDRADHLPGDRHRQGSLHQRDGHHHRDDRPQRPGSLCIAERIRNSI